MVRMEFCYKRLWPLLVKTSFSIGTGKSYLVKDDDWIIIIFRFFRSWRRPYLGKIEKNWNRHHHTLESLITPITTIQLLIGMWFLSCTCHSCNGAQCQTSGTIHLIWRTESKTYNDEGFWNLSTEFTLNFIFELFSCAALHVWVLFQSKFHKAGVTCRRSRLMQRKSLTG